MSRELAELVGGPYDGRNPPLPVTSALAVSYICANLTSRGWEHYDRSDDTTYRYSGPCVGIEHEGGQPGGPWCDDEYEEER